jgi:sugar phosphate isomerase/epimerase
MHERISVNSLCFPEAGWPELAEHWRKCGTHRASFLSPLLDAGVETAQQVLAGGGLKLETITHLFTTAHLGPSDDDWKAERAALSRVIDAAARLGGNSVYMMAGGHGDLTFEEAAEHFAHAVAPCAEQARAARVALLVEPAPPLYADGHIAHSLRDTLVLAEIAGLGVCIDIYSCWFEADLKRTIERAMDRCHLVQISDYRYGDRGYPSRAIPGEGDIPLERIVGWILDAGYTGGFDFELIGPRIAEAGYDEAVRRAGDYTSELLAKLGA